MIKIKITYPSGTQVALEIPLSQEAEIQAPASTSAVSPLSEEQAAFLEAANKVSEELLCSTQVQDSSDLNVSQSSREGKDEGEVGEGVVGGVGEEEGEVVREKEGEPEKPIELHEFKFICDNGELYSPTKSLVDDFIFSFGEPLVRQVFCSAKAWLSANPAKRKTSRGVGRFLNAWLCREAGRERTPIKAQIAKPLGLLEDGNKNSDGW